jgi:hypothetical protein
LEGFLSQLKTESIYWEGLGHDRRLIKTAGPFLPAILVRGGFGGIVMYVLSKQKDGRNILRVSNMAERHGSGDDEQKEEGVILHWEGCPVALLLPPRPSFRKRFSCAKNKKASHGLIHSFVITFRLFP